MSLGEGLDSAGGEEHETSKDLFLKIFVSLS